MKKLFLSTITAVLVSITPVSHAEISATDLPSMGNLAKLIGEADKSLVEESVYDGEGQIASGMLANDSARGNTSFQIAEILGDGNDEQTTRLVQGIDEVRVEFENFLTNAGFAPNDIGVAMAVSFITLWEMASTRELPPQSALEVGKFLVHSFSAPETLQMHSNLTETEKAVLLDWLMTTPVAFSAMIKLFEAQGSNEQAQSLRQKSAELFKDVFQIPHTFITITDAGELSFDIEHMEAYQQGNGISNGSSNNQSTSSNTSPSTNTNSETSDELSSDW